MDDNLLGDNLSLFRPGRQHVGWQPERGKIRRPDHSPEPQPQTQRHQETAAGLKNYLSRAFPSLTIFPVHFFPFSTCFPVNPALFAANLRGRLWALCSPCGKSQALSCLKGVWHEIFDFGFVSMNQFPWAPEYTIAAISNFLRKFAEVFTTPAINDRQCLCYER
jgi:hypothetical protein